MAKVGGFAEGGVAFPTILQANVQSMSGKVEDLSKRLEEKEVDVCAVTNGRIKDTDNSKVPGYSLWAVGRGDVALYVRDDITSTKLPIQAPAGLEVLWVRLDSRGLPGDVSCMVFCVVYHPHAHTSTLTAPLITHLLEVVTGIYSREPDTGIIILGAFRDFPEHKLPLDLNLQQVVNKPTQRDTEVIVTNLSHYYKKPKILRPIASSPHKTVYWVPK
ncbi:hypothetical protein E2C01_086450 [Portunus trituberculatus]|uniref:Endonuclease/exonuclease/phosphatase domain-containing protein n=1 Tax=Portunus trituberculatus TaxID=210409 RepID=A0A5B7J9Q6_PORTR|nr:hypothetical protein [Portunus trituberculatus]